MHSLRWPPARPWQISRARTYSRGQWLAPRCVRSRSRAQRICNKVVKTEEHKLKVVKANDNFLLLTFIFPLHSPSHNHTHTHSHFPFSSINRTQSVECNVTVVQAENKSKVTSSVSINFVMCASSWSSLSVTDEKRADSRKNLFKPILFWISLLSDNKNDINYILHFILYSSCMC